MFTDDNSVIFWKNSNDSVTQRNEIVLPFNNYPEWFNELNSEKIGDDKFHLIQSSLYDVEIRQSKKEGKQGLFATRLFRKCNYIIVFQTK